MNIWHFQSKLTRRLLIWSLFSMSVGLLLQIPRNRFARGFGQQFAAWGLVDALIAVIGLRSTKKRYAQFPDPQASEVIESETRKLYKILWFNTALDMAYVAGGLAMVLIKGKNHTTWRGHGIGVMIQGAFLFLFDCIHACKLRKPWKNGISPQVSDVSIQ